MPAPRNEIPPAILKKGVKDYALNKTNMEKLCQLWHCGRPAVRAILIENGIIPRSQNVKGKFHRTKQEVEDIHKFAFEHGGQAAGEKYGISRERVNQLFQGYGLPPLGGTHNTRKLTKEFLEELSKCVNFLEAKKRAGVSYHTLRAAFKKFGVPCPKRAPRPIPADLLEEGLALYRTRKEGLHFLARFWKASFERIRDILKENGIALNKTGKRLDRTLAAE